MPTQAERRATTRQALLDAAAATLVKRGASGFTTTAVAETAALSNGALFRHFPTRLDLVSTTVEHVLAELRGVYATNFNRSATATTPEELLELLWVCMSDQRLAAVYELYAQCRTDDDLLRSIQPIVMDHLDQIGVLAATVMTRIDDPVPPYAVPFVTLAILSMQGLIINNLAGASIGVERDLIIALADSYRLNRSSPSSGPSPGDPQS